MYSNRVAVSLQICAVVLIVGVLVMAVPLFSKDIQADIQMQTGVGLNSNWPAPVFDASDAISRSLEYFPEGVVTTDQVARLVDYDTIRAWRAPHGIIASSGDAPVWVVGFLGDGLTVEQIFESLPFTGSYTGDSLEVDGAYYLLDANGGHLKSAGPLEDSLPQTFSSLVALQDMPITVVTSTLPAPVPTTDPTSDPWH